MDYNYDQELKETYTKITESGGVLYDDNKYVVTDYDFEGKKDLCDRISLIIQFDNITVDNSGISYDKYPNLVFFYNSDTKEVSVKQKQPIAEYCEEHSIYCPEKKNIDELTTSKISFNVADLENSYEEWLEIAKPTWEDVAIEISAQRFFENDGETNFILTNHPAYITFFDYCNYIACKRANPENEDEEENSIVTDLKGFCNTLFHTEEKELFEFSLESFVEYLALNNFSGIERTKLPDYTFDPKTGLITFEFDNTHLDPEYKSIQMALIALKAYEGKVANDFKNGNKINYRFDIDYLLDCFKTMGKNVTAENLETYLKDCGLSVLYKDGSYLYLQSEVDNEKLAYDILNNGSSKDLLTLYLLLDNNSDSLYEFDLKQLEKKSNCNLGISGMDLGTLYISSLMFDEDSEEYKTFVKTYGDIGKIYSSTYNGYTVYIPQLLENGEYKDAFKNVPSGLYNLVNSNEQTLENLGYTLSVRKDSMIEYGPDGYSCEDYKNIVAITNEEGKITGYKIVLNNNQYEIVEPDDNRMYVLFDPNNDNAVDSVVKRSTAYDCLEITNSLKEQYKFADAKYANGKYYLTINGEQIVLDEEEVRGPDNLINADLIKTINSKYRDDSIMINNEITVYNNRIVNKPKCISFDDETNYRGLVTYLKTTFNDLITGIKLQKASNDDKDIYSLIGMDKVKLKFDEAIEEATESGVKIETSVRVLKTYDYDLKSIFDLMINDIFKLGVVAKDETITFKGDKSYDSKEYQSSVVNLQFDGNIDKYIDSLKEYCDKKLKDTDSAYKWALEGLELTQEDIDLLNKESGLNLRLSPVTKTIDGIEETRYFLDVNGLNTLSAALLRKNGDSFNMESWLNSMLEKDENYINVANQWDYYNAMVNNTDNIANEIALYKKVKSVAPLAKYAVTDEYEQVLDYVRRNYNRLGFTDITKCLSLEELSLYLMDAKYDKKLFEDDIVSHLKGNYLILDDEKIKTFLKSYGIDDIVHRQARMDAVEEASKSVEDGGLSFLEQETCQNGYLSGLTKYGKNTIDYIYCGILGEESPWTVEDTKKEYLLELYGGDYTKSEVEEMYRNGLITKADYDVRMAVLRPENTIKYDFQEYSKVSGFLEGLGGATADVFITTCFGASTLSVLKAVSAAGKVARKLHDAGDSYGETLAVSTLTGIASYFISKGYKDLKKARGGHLFSGNGTYGNYSTEELDAFGDTLNKGDIVDIQESLRDYSAEEISSLKRSYLWYNFYKGKFGNYAFDAGKQFLMSGNGIDTLTTNLITTTSYSIWQSLEGEDETSYSFEKYFHDDVFAVLSLLEEGNIEKRATKVRDNFGKSTSKDILTWLVNLGKKTSS